MAVEVGDEPELVAVESAVVYANRWMTVREDKTVSLDGRKGIFGVVEKPDFALVIPYADGGFHLVEQYRYPVQGRYWEFPQGSWESEQDVAPLELARGELREETGLRAGSMEIIGHLFEAYGYSNQGFHVVLATDLIPGEQALEDTEQGLVTRWVAEDELWEMVATGSFKDAPSLAALALFGRYRRTSGGGVE